jgi:hypothetical protein
MYRAVHAATAHQRGIGGINYGIDILAGNIPLYQLQGNSCVGGFDLHSEE